MQSEAILAIDQGTHASRAAIFDQHGQVLCHAEQAISLYRHSDVEVEQDAAEILYSVRAVIEQVLTQSSQAVRVAGLATQRSTLVAWDKSSGEALAPVISWQDRRSAELLQQYTAHHQTIERITGLVLSPHYLAGKMLWMLQHFPAVKNALKNHRLALGPLSSFLCFNLLENQPYVIDHSNAGRSLLFDICERHWSSELLSLFTLPEDLLPECVPTVSSFGKLKSTGIELACVCGDQNAAVHAHGIPDHHTALINLGTGAFVLMLQGDTCRLKRGLLTGLASSMNGDASYLLEGTVNGAGAALSTLQEKWPDRDIITSLPGWLHEVRDPPVYINGIAGLGSPWWIDSIDSRFIPHTDDCATQAVAVIESIVFLLYYNLHMMSDDRVDKIIISGGLSALDGLCQRLADLSGLSVNRHQDHEATLRGVAWFCVPSQRPWDYADTVDIFKVCLNTPLQQRYQKFRHEMEKLMPS